MIGSIPVIVVVMALITRLGRIIVGKDYQTDDFHNFLVGMLVIIVLATVINIAYLIGNAII